MASQLPPTELAAPPVDSAIAEPPTPILPAIWISAPTGKSPLRLSKVDIQCRALPLVVETELTLTYLNDSDQDLAGELVFPLPPDSFLCGYALDVAGQLVEAVPVEHHRARMVFENELRRNVDPGLVEHVRGNVFRTRVWPIPAYKRRIVRLQYVTELPIPSLTDSEPTPFFDLPIDFHPPSTDAVATAAPADDTTEMLTQILPQFSLRIQVPEASASPDTAAPSVTSCWRDFGFQWTDSGWIAEKQGRLIGGGRIRIYLPLRTDAHALPMLERHDQETFFACPIRLKPTAPLLTATTSQNPADERDQLSKQTAWAICWDASFSRQEAAHQREIDFVKLFCHRLHQGTIDLYFCRDRIEPAGSFTVVGGECPELLRSLADVVYDGGTGLNGAPKNFKNQTWHGMLWFTDGLPTLGERFPPTLQAALFPINSSIQSDQSLLQHWANRYGGLAFDLLRELPEAILSRLFQPVPRFLRWECLQGEVTHLFPQPQTAVSDSFLFLGQLGTDTATVKLFFGTSETPTTYQEVLLELNATDIKKYHEPASKLLARCWARRQIDWLSSDLESNRQELRTLGQKYNLVTPGTSFLVLETLEQHL